MMVNTVCDPGCMTSTRRRPKALPLVDVSACCPDGLVEPLDRREAEDLAAVLRAVADPARLQLLALIRSAGEACACDLTEPLGLAQPTVSHHLKILVTAGLIQREQRGQWAWFRADEDRLSSLGDLFRPRAG
jgi:ArsR family transcriptional regulator